MANHQKFEVLRITSHSDLPIRNSAEKLIYGDHVLWDVNDSYADKHGSLAPNAFAYDFSSPLATNSTLHITLKAIDEKVLGGLYSLQGSLDSSVVFASESFSFTSLHEITIAVSATNPLTSPRPISICGDFAWSLAPREHYNNANLVSYTSLARVGLELYWISQNIHELFLGGLSGVYIDFLRYAIPVYKNEGHDNRQVEFVPPQDAAQQAFSNYSKIYDTFYGAPRFGATHLGGRFNYRHYISANAGGRPGSLSPWVNCFDQAAMVQVLATTGSSRPSWLLQEPHGFINPTFLVGVPDRCNNPFFSRTGQPPMVGVNSADREPFLRHVFNGWSNVIYDGCGGPHLGTENPTLYVRNAIDTLTILYGMRPESGPGTVDNIKQFPGVTPIFLRLYKAEVTKHMEKFLRKCATTNTAQFSQIHWDDVGQWVKEVLGDSCEVAFQDTSMGDGVAESLWHLTGADGAGGDVVIRVRAETRIGKDGDLDYDKGSREVYDDLVFTLKDIQFDLGPNDEKLDTLWEPAPFQDYAQYALQHTANIPRGRFLILSGNAMVDISGSSSSAGLEPVVRKLLTHTTVDTPSSLHIPKVTKHFLEIPELSRGPSDEVKGLFTSFDAKCFVNGLIAAASADVEGHGLLLSKVNIRRDEDAKSSTVVFTFVSRTVGTHDVDLWFEQACTMSSGSKRIQVIVVEA